MGTSAAMEADIVETTTMEVEGDFARDLVR